MSELACPHCGEHKVRAVLHPSLIDYLLSFFSADAYRCRACRKRFHRFRWKARDQTQADVAP
ncbi:MAG: hypothetical protein ACKV22_26225 [Bryobacteraceae bacterium]